MKMEGKRQVVEIVLCIPSDDKYIHLVDLVVSYIAKEMGFDEEVEQQLELAVIEAGTNAIKHGNRDDPEKVVQFRFRIAEDRLTAFVKDCGPGFDLEGIGDPLSPGNLMKPCGRGIFLMRALMDEVEYNMDESCGTQVRLVKYKNSSQRKAAGGRSSCVPKLTSLTNVLVNLAALSIMYEHARIRGDNDRRKQVGISQNGSLHHSRYMFELLV